VLPASILPLTPKRKRQKRCAGPDILLRGMRLNEARRSPFPDVSTQDGLRETRLASAAVMR
jgi:hypothetical protein